MKIKTALITVVTCAALAAGGAFAAYRVMKANVTPVTVVPVSNVNAWYGEDDSEEMYGVIVSMDGQVVELDSEHKLTKVYVKAGDTVKIGDPLLEYDMTMETLKREMADLDMQILELSLGEKEKELERFKQNPNAVASEDSDSLTDYDTADLDTDTDDDSLSESADDVDFVTLDDNEIKEHDENDSSDYTDLTQEDDQSGDTQGETSSDGSSDDGGDPDPNDFGTDSEDDALIEGEGDDEIIDDGEDVSEYAEDYLLTSIQEFLSLESLLRIQYSKDPSSLNSENLTKAIELFTEDLAEVPNLDDKTIDTFTDAFHEEREEGIYLLKDGVTSYLSDMESSYKDSQSSFSAKDMEVSLYRAFANILFYKLVNDMETLNATVSGMGVTADTITSEQATDIKQTITNAADSYYMYAVNWNRYKQMLQKVYGVSEETIELINQTYLETIKAYSGSNDQLSDETGGTLSQLIYKLNEDDMFTPESQTETEFTVETEPYSEVDFDDFEEYYEEDDGESLTQEEIEEGIRDREEDIAEVKRQMREAEIEIRQYDRVLSEQKIVSKINGVVKSAGTVDGGGSDDGFIVLSGEAGMYVQGNISELKLDTIKVGDRISGTCEENGGYFEAEITEISQYPSTGDTDSYVSWYSTENTNVSYYPFTAYIEDSSEVEEGSATISLENDSSSDTKIYLENYMIRMDSAGKSYVYVMGDNELLEKRIVKTGASLWGAETEIVSGLSSEDLIAFPYGKNVKEGASVKIGDYLDDSVYG